MLNQIKHFIKPAIDDPEEIRRRQLIRILALGLLAFSSIGLLLIIAFLSANPEKWQKTDNQLLVVSAVFAILACASIYYLNKFSSRLASFLFLLMLTLISLFSDTPAELSNGRSLFIFMIPIAISSLIFTPVSSFVFAIINSISIIYLAIISQTTPNVAAVFAFFMLALVSWLSSRSLEQALKEVRTINAELDLRVKDRTKELSQALAREAEQSGQRQAILQGIADGVVVFDVRGKAILANPALSRLTSLPLDEIIGAQAISLLEIAQIAPEDRETLLNSFTHAEASLAPLRIHWGHKTLSVSSAPVLDTNNRLIGNVAVFRDFTREAEVEEMKNSFVAMVSHELRTPLNAILGYSEMLRDAYYGPVNEKQANVSDRILSNSRRLLDIVSDLLDKAQIEAGHLSLEINTVPTAEMLENLHSVMDKIAHDKNLELYSDLAPEMPASLKIDPKRIQQIMINLVNNAVKFTEEGSITVKVYKVAEAYWAFDVTDTGPGIAIEDQKYIFDPFRQVDKTITRSHGGIGLGLSIVKRLVDLMGGRIFLKSIVGQGSTFTVVLPLEPIQKGKKA